MTVSPAFNRWWVVSRPNAAALLRLLCFPHAGGNASMSRTWHAMLPNEIEVCAAQLPGRANRIAEPAFHRLADIVEEIGTALTPLMDKPLALFGHSMGAVVSFEVARWLRRHRGLQPVHLFVSGRRAPHLPHMNPPHYLASDDEFLVKLSELNGTPIDLFREPALFQLVLPTLRADFEAVETYQYTDEPPLDCPIMVFGGRDDEESFGDRLDSWRLHSTGSCTKHVMDGGHFFIQSNEHQVLSLMRTELMRTIVPLRFRVEGASSGGLLSGKRI